MFGHILTYESKIICRYIDLNFSVCKIIEFTLRSLKEMLEALGLSKMEKPRRFDITNTTKASTVKNFF